MVEVARSKLVVIDTNVLVSALISPKGHPFSVVSQVFRGLITPCFDQEILEEYTEVLGHPKFGFAPDEVKKFMHTFQSYSYYVFADEVNSSAIRFVDEDDRKFYDLALSCTAILITGNKRHYPDEPWIVSPAEFLVLI